MYSRCYHCSFIHQRMWITRRASAKNRQGTVLWLAIAAALLASAASNSLPQAPFPCEPNPDGPCVDDPTFLAFSLFSCSNPDQSPCTISDAALEACPIACGTCQPCLIPESDFGFDVVVQSVAISDTRVSVWVYSPEKNIAGFQFQNVCTQDDDSIITIDAISGDGGEAANNTLAVSVGEEGIWIAFSFEGASIPPGYYPLTTLTVPSLSELGCQEGSFRLQSEVLSDENANGLNACGTVNSSCFEAPNAILPPPSPLPPLQSPSPISSSPPPPLQSPTPVSSPPPPPLQSPTFVSPSPPLPSPTLVSSPPPPPPPPSPAPVSPSPPPPPPAPLSSSPPLFSAPPPTPSTETLEELCGGREIIVLSPATGTSYKASGTDEPVCIFGTGGSDFIIGTNGDDIIYGMGGNDVIFGKSGSDTIYGGDGKDKIRGNRGNDVIYGGKGADSLGGGKDDDILMGNAGKDIITGKRGADTLYGGGGVDTIKGGGGPDTLYAKPNDVVAVCSSDLAFSNSANIVSSFPCS